MSNSKEEPMPDNTKPIVPVFMAKTDLDKGITGRSFFEDSIRCDIEGEWILIDKYTLTMSLDGTKFYSMEEVRRALEFSDKIDKGLTNGTIDIIGIEG
jgi:hypothetical protein